MVDTSAKSAIDAWREANEEARVAENAVARAWEDFFERRGPSVTVEMQEEVARLRARANHLLTAAMAAINRR